MYCAYLHDFIGMLTELQAMPDSQIRQINVKIYQVELHEDTARVVHLALYRAGPKTIEFKSMQIKKMLSRKVTEPAQNKSAAPAVFAPTKDGALHFCVDYRILNALTKRYLCLFPRTDACIDFLGELAGFYNLDANKSYCQSQDR